MKLLIDIGNTRSKLAYADKSNQYHIKAIDNNALTSDWIDQYFSDASQIILSSVASNRLKGLIKQWAKSKYIDFICVKTEPETFGVKNSYAEPSQMGVDRWLAILGANALYPNETVIIVDSGTATTVELLESNTHLGGWILPGIDMMYESLQSNTSKVIATPNDATAIELGTNTSDCVNNASVAATVGLIELAKRLAFEKGHVESRIILAGGNAQKLSPLLQTHNTVEPALIFYGMQRYGSN